MRDRFYRFMQGRNGMDDLARFESMLLWIPVVLMFLLRKIAIASTICDVVFWIMVVHTYFRVFSKNLVKRGEENRKFLDWRYSMAVKKNKAQRRRDQKRDHRFYKCPNCKQEVRVPKGRGKIEITCPRCHEQFVRRS